MGTRAPTIRHLGRALALAAALAGGAPAAGVTPAGPRDRCPVCGMFVAKYPDFAAQIALKNGQTLHFDGVKDLARRWLGTGGGPALRPEEVQAVWVQDYYGLKWTDGRKAFYVLGSDVFGPMGKELIPFATQADAREFFRDHRGTAVLAFRDLTRTILKQLE